MLVALSTNYLSAQCSFTKQVGHHSTTYICKPEKVYLNEDLENGLNEYDLRLVLTVDTNTKVLPYHFLQCKYSVSGSFSKEECVPRSIVFQSTDGNFIGPIWALKEEDVESGVRDCQTRLYTYELTIEEYSKLGNVSLKGVSFWDKRTKRNVEASPYADLIKEQVQCLLALSDPIK